jgi:hypothetical protein
VHNSMCAHSPMSAYGTKRTSSYRAPMSAFGGKADMTRGRSAKNWHLVDILMRSADVLREVAARLRICRARRLKRFRE